MKAAEERSALERIMDRADYWRMVKETAQEGSGVARFAERMIRIYGEQAQKAVAQLDG